MRLGDKGPIKPPPPLDGPAARTANAVQGWTEIIPAAHWDLYRPTQVNGVDFYVGDSELGHIHLDGVVHLATPPALGEPLVERGLAKRFPYGGASYAGWTMLRIRTEADALHASWLFRVGYDWLKRDADCHVAEADCGICKAAGWRVRLLIIVHQICPVI